MDFWEDRWSGKTTLRSSFPEIFHLFPRKNLRISDCLSSNGWCWDMIPGVDNYVNFGANSGITALKDKISNVPTSQGQDSVHWSWSTDGRLTVKSTYSTLRDRGTRDAHLGGIGPLCLPLKIKVFCWLVLKKRSLTADNLIKRGWICNTKCMLCGLEEKTVDHLFSKCIVTRFFMATI
uniref:Reverse transcriptase zinc-binding domain-containing protein n=1 Tax=Ananas comosus var. bracteatus TaxID=296719 RepID=A0A6V7P7W0_ANACO|nr:unnamed protein product [Ananas comosus var. bracteatus]